MKPETELCISITKYLEIYAVKYNFIFWHNSNETTTKNFGWITNQKKMGKKAGVPDYVLFHKNLTILMEVKPSTKSKLTSSQENFIKEAENKNLDKNIIIVYGWEDFVRKIENEFFNKIIPKSEVGANAEQVLKNYA